MKIWGTVIVLAFGLALCTQVLLENVSRGQSLVTPTVASLFDSLTEGVDRIIQQALDRLDLTLMNAAMEARATINAAKTQFDDSLTKTVDELDAPQRRLIEDLKSLNRALGKNISDVTREFRDGLTRTTTDVRLLVSNNPGAMFVTAKPAVVTDDALEIEVKGTALSRARLDEFSVQGIVLTPEVHHADDQRVTFGVAIARLEELGILTAATSAPVPLSFSLRFVERSWLPRWLLRLFGWTSTRGPFVAKGLILPKKLGEIQAVFATVEPGVERREQTRGPFRSARVKTTLSGFPPRVRRGHRTDMWTATPSDGWKIDPATARFEFLLHFDSCWSAESSATWIEQNEHILKVRAYISAERMIGKTCRATTNIYFEEWRPTKVRRDVRSGVRILSAGETVVLKLADGGAKTARLAHLEIWSSTGGDKRKVHRINELPQYLTADYDRNAQAVYVTAKYLR